MTDWLNTIGRDCAEGIDRLAGVRLDPHRFVAPTDRLELLRFLLALVDRAHERGYRAAQDEARERS